MLLLVTVVTVPYVLTHTQAVCRNGLAAIRHFLLGNTLEQGLPGDDTAAPAAASAAGGEAMEVGCAQCSSRQDDIDKLRK